MYGDGNFLLRFFIQLGAYNGFLDAPIVRLGWVMLRDIANMFFVVALLVIAFATILGRESYEWKKAMVKLVLVAILVNFSLLICGIVLDAAHVFTVTFINAIAPVAAGNLITMFNLGDMERIIADSSAGGSPDVELALFGGAAVALFFSAMAALTIGAYCIILLYRMVAIWSLLIFSPLAFVMSVLPATESYFEEWKSEFTKNILSAPIAVFFLWLAFATMGANSAVSHIDQYSSRPLEDSGSSNTAADTSINNISGNTATNSVSLNVASTWANMAGFLVAMAFLLKGIEQVQSLGVRGAGWLDSAQTFAKNVATIGSGVALGGWLLGKGRDLGVNTTKNVGLAVGTQTGVVQAWKRTFTGKGLFAGAGQRAEARLERLEEEKSQKESMQKALGKRNPTIADKALKLVRLKTAGESLATATVKAELAQKEAEVKSTQTKTEIERKAEEGGLDNRVLPGIFSRSGGGNIQKRIKDNVELDIRVEQQKKALDDFRLAEKRSAVKTVWQEENAKKKEATIQALIDGKIKGVSLSGLDSEKQKKLKEAKDAYDTLVKSRTASKTDIAAAELVVEEAMKKAQNADSYQNRRQNDALIARVGGFSISDASIQNIRASENEGDEKDSLEGARGEYDVAYALAENNSLKDELAVIDKELIGIFLEPVKQKLKAEIDDLASDKTKLLEKKKDLQEQRVVAGNSGDKATVDTLNSEIASVDEQISESDKAFVSKSQTILDPALLNAEVVRNITSQDRAVAYKEAGLHDKYIKFGGEVYAREQQKYVNKAKAVSGRLAVRAADVVRGVESKAMDELDEEIETAAKKVITNGSRAKGQFDLHVREMQNRYDEIRRVRAKMGRNEKLTDKEVDSLKNATQDLSALIAGGVDQFKSAFGAVLQSIGGLGKDGVTLDTAENLPKAILALLSGKGFGDVENTDDGELVGTLQSIRKEQFKEKEEEFMAALRMSFNNSGYGQYNNQIAYGYDERGHRTLGFTRLAGKGIQLGDEKNKPAAFTTGSSDDGRKMQESLAESNVYSAQIIQQLKDLRMVFGTGKNYGLGGAHIDGKMKQLAEQLALISSNQVDLSQWRRLGGGSGDGGAFDGTNWTIREAQYGKYFAKMLKGWQEMLADPTRRLQEKDDVVKRMRNLLSANGVTQVDGKDIAVASAQEMGKFFKNLNITVKGGALDAETRTVLDEIKNKDFQNPTNSGGRGVAGDDSEKDGAVDEDPSASSSSA
jgi:hypothetical protein